MALAVKSGLITEPRTKMFSMKPPACVDFSTLPSKLSDLCDWFWRDLAIRHRVYRGEGRKIKNLPFAGYYFGAVNQQIESVMWEVGDLVKIACVCGNLIIREHKFSMAAIQSLPFNEINVFFPTKRMLGEAKEMSGYGLYCTYENDREVIVFDEDTSLTEKPAVYKHSVKYYGKLKKADAYLAAMMDWCEGSETKFGLFYMNPVLLEHFSAHLMPSLHVHAGHVLVCSKELPKSVEDLSRKLVLRAIKANYYKTYFPYSRQAFGFSDQFRPIKPFIFKQVEKYVDDDYTLLMERDTEGFQDEEFDVEGIKALEEARERAPLVAPPDSVKVEEVLSVKGSNFTFSAALKSVVGRRQPGEGQVEDTAKDTHDVSEDETFDCGEEA